MIYEETTGQTRLVHQLGFFVEFLLPFEGVFDRFGVGSVADDYTAGDMSNVQWLESSLGVQIGTLVPELNTNFFSIQHQNFEVEIIRFF